MQVIVKEVTPSIAAELLKSNTNNRNITESRVNMYAKAMAEGAWELTGDTIKLSSDGRLMDGQHRLLAVVKSGKTVKFAIAHGVDPKAFDAIDTGKPRTAGDVLIVDGVKRYARSTASVGRMMVSERRGMLNPESPQLVPGGGVVTNHEIREVIENNLDVMDAVEDVMRRFRQVTSYLPPAIAAFVLWKARKDSPEQADAYFTGLAEGTGLEKGSPILTVRERLMRESRKGASHRGRQYLVLMNGFLSFREGKAMHRVQASGAHSGAKQASRFTRKLRGLEDHDHAGST